MTVSASAVDMPTASKADVPHDRARAAGTRAGCIGKRFPHQKFGLMSAIIPTANESTASCQPGAGRLSLRVEVFDGAMGEALIVTLGRGADLHAGILAACLARGVRDAAIVSGVATVTPVVLHEVTSEGFPIEEHIRTLNGPGGATSIPAPGFSTWQRSSCWPFDQPDLPSGGSTRPVPTFG